MGSGQVETFLGGEEATRQNPDKLSGGVGGGGVVGGWVTGADLGIL